MITLLEGYEELSSWVGFRSRHAALVMLGLTGMLATSLFTLLTGLALSG